MTLPVRERVVAQIARKLEGMTVADNNGVEFAFVQREELDHTKKFQGSSVSVLDTNETYTYQTAYLLSTLRVGIEFWYQMKAGDVASTQLGIVAAEIKKLILSDVNLIEDETDLQLCENVQIVEDNYDIDGPFEKVVSGYIQFNFMFRTNKENPYTLM